MKASFPALAMTLALADSAVAQDEVDCQNPITQADMNYCEAQAYAAADAELEEVWADARAAARDTDADLPANLKGAEEALVAAQRGWMGYRDGQCQLAGFEARGGSMEPMLISGCLRELTEKRTQELKDYIAGPAQ